MSSSSNILTTYGFASNCVCTERKLIHSIQVFIDEGSCFNHFREVEKELLGRDVRFHTTKARFKLLACVSSGSLQVRYNLGGLKEPFAIDVDQRNLANGQPHSINMSRVDRSITIQVQVHARAHTSQRSRKTHSGLLVDSLNRRDVRFNFKIPQTEKSHTHILSHKYTIAPVLARWFAFSQRGEQCPVLSSAVMKLLVLCHC